MPTSRLEPWFLGALLAAGAGCDALIGLGDEPSGSGPAATSTGDAGTASTTSSAAGGAPSTSSSAGGGNGGGGGDPGATSSSGSGGEGGGGEPPGPCGGLEPDGVGACTLPGDDGACRVRTYRVGSVVSTADGSQIGIANRLGRGIAVLPTSVVFSAFGPGLDDDGADDAVRLYRVHRWTGDVREGDVLYPRSVSLTAAAGRAVAAVLDGEVGELDLDGNIVPFDDGLNLNAITGSGPRVFGAGRGDAEVYEITPGVQAAPCQLSSASATAGQPTVIDLRVVPWDGGDALLATNWQNANVTLTPLGKPCDAGDTAVFGPASGFGFGATMLDGYAWLKIAATGNEVLVLPVGTEPPENQMLTNPTRAIGVWDDRLVVPIVGEGLASCDGDGLCEAFVPPLGEELVGDVAEIEVFDWGLITLGFDGDREGPGDAVITCVDLR